jgi:predicted site-specific integrase-resolvase
MDKLLSISEAAKVLGVSESTLCRWDREGRLSPDKRTEFSSRLYGARSKKNQKLLEGMQKAVDNADRP